MSQAQRARLCEIAKTPVLAATPADPDDLRELSAAQLVEMRKLSNDYMTDDAVTPYNFETKHYNNPAVKLCLVFPGETNLTSFFSPTLKVTTIVEL